MFILLQLLVLLRFIRQSSGVDFSPDRTDYDAYGLKIAANSMMIVEAQNYYTQFLIQFAPYTDNIGQTTQQSCSIEYDDPSQYVYAVALGKGQTTYDIFYVGEMIGMSEDDPLENRTFVNVLRYNGSLTTIDCVSGFTSIPHYITMAFPHQEHLVMVTDPLGLFAYGFSDLFTFFYTLATNTLIIHPNNSLSPSTSFLPFAVDYDGSLGVIAGFLDNGRNSLTKYRATVILFNISAATAIATPVSTWTYSANETWQARQTNAGADQYTAKFDMSVSVNPTAKQALVGIQSMNMVFLFGYTSTPLTLVSFLSPPGQAVGFGKGVAWLNYTLNSFAILVNVYSMSYVWSSSNIYVYESALTNISTPVSVFPNIQQSLYTYMSSVFLNIITTPNNLVLLDNQGGLFVILPAASGYYSSTSGPSTQIVPAFSSSLPCIPGTYKNMISILRCLPCPTGTKNDGTNPMISSCVNCRYDTFCPLGATSDISNDLLNNVTQAVAYPESPDLTLLDDILFLTLFSVGSTGRCVVLSPIFWTCISGLIAIIIGVTMLIMRHCVATRTALARYKIMAKIFKQTDVIGEGEMWAGGLGTLCIVLLCTYCYVFSALYYNQYPIEAVGPSTFTCDTTLMNAKFDSSLRSLSVSVEDNLQAMIDLLDNQVIYLNVAFINTIYNCSSDPNTLTYLIGSTWIPISTSNCSYSDYILSYSAILPFKPITVQFYLPNIYMIGGLRIGLSGVGQAATGTLLNLGFSQTFSQSGSMLSQNADVALELTKVINDTAPLEGSTHLYSGLWIGSFTINYYESFMTTSEYLYAKPNAGTSLTVAITETSYYIFNVQSPITRKNELIFHNLLFTFLIIDLFALSFLFVKLAILPLVSLITQKYCPSLIKNNRIGSGGTGSKRSSVELEHALMNSSQHQNHTNHNASDNHHLNRQTTNLSHRQNNEEESQPVKEVVADSTVDESPKKFPPIVRIRIDGDITIKETVQN